MLNGGIEIIVLDIFISICELVLCNTICIIYCVSVPTTSINTSLVYRNTFFFSDFVLSWLTAKGE